MRLFSNTLLSWPQIIHATHYGRLHPGRWHNYYFYHISRVNPLILTTHSPLEFLQENHQFYCYHSYNRDKISEKLDNKREFITIHRQEMDYHETWIYVPSTISVDDILVVKDKSGNGWAYEKQGGHSPILA